jgi:hypothetical protein
MKSVGNNLLNPLSSKVDCITDYPVVNTGWIIKRWFKIDQNKILDWYYQTKNQYSDWFWVYGKHKDMWKYDPNDLTGNGLKEDTSWLMLTWGNNKKGPVPWLRFIAKPEYDSNMPKNNKDEPLGARECCTGYALEIFNTMPCPPHDIQIAVHSPGTALPQHQDKQDKFRFHIPIITHIDSRFIINGENIHLPADGWCYLVNTSYLHSTENHSNIDRVHIYGNVWTDDVLALKNLDTLETIL